MFLWRNNKNATLFLTNGVHVIKSRVKVIVSEYAIMTVNENGYEAHHKFINIHVSTEWTEEEPLFSYWEFEGNEV